MPHPFNVTILGLPFTVQSDEDEAYVHELAAFVEGRMRRAASAGGTVAVAVLAALHIADELHKLQRDFAQLTRQIEDLSRNLARTLKESEQAQVQI